MRDLFGWSERGCLLWHVNTYISISLFLSLCLSLSLSLSLSLTHIHTLTLSHTPSHTLSIPIASESGAQFIQLSAPSHLPLVAAVAITSADNEHARTSAITRTDHVARCFRFLSAPPEVADRKWANNTWFCASNDVMASSANCWNEINLRARDQCPISLKCVHKNSSKMVANVLPEKKFLQFLDGPK
jgi:hypothetical protein